MTASIAGIVPVMLTPFHDDGRIDWPGYERLIEWYLAHGAQALFAVCQSSEMFRLELGERRALAEFTAKAVAGRVPVVASGHVSDALKDQKRELGALLDTGIDGIVLVTNRLAPEGAGPAALRTHLDALLDFLPADVSLGLYECPAPYRRLLTDEEVRYCAESGRFALLKDVSCDLATVKARVDIARGTPLAVVNANGAIASEALAAGAGGFCGVFTNVHPDLYRWLQDRREEDPELAEELATFLVLAAATEPMGYPALAKLYHNRIGTFASARCRVIDYDIVERYWWGLEATLDRVARGTERFRERIARSSG